MKEYVKKTNNPRMGRPSIKIDKDEFEKLCGIQCTEEEIAGWYKCSIDTVENWCKKTYKTTFSDVYKKLSATGKIASIVDLIDSSLGISFIISPLRFPITE